jgi:hypothetical protein
MLRNTKWVHAIAIFTGKDTKLVRNSRYCEKERVVRTKKKEVILMYIFRATPAKRSNVERVTNRQVLLIFAFQLVLCSFCAIAARIWLVRTSLCLTLLLLSSLHENFYVPLLS